MIEFPNASDLSALSSNDIDKFMANLRDELVKKAKAGSRKYILYKNKFPLEFEKDIVKILSELGYKIINQEDLIIICW